MEDVFSPQLHFPFVKIILEIRPFPQPWCRSRMSGNPLRQSSSNINHPLVTHVMFTPHFGAGFNPPILFGMYDVEELVLPASENLLVSYLCKVTAFASSRQITEFVCIENGHSGRDNCVEGFRFRLGSSGCARVGPVLGAATKSPVLLFRAERSFHKKEGSGV